jgi:hypothetical protein
MDHHIRLELACAGSIGRSVILAQPRAGTVVSMYREDLPIHSLKVFPRGTH